MDKLIAPKSWMKMHDYYKDAITKDWYKNIALIQSELVNLTFDFFRMKDIKSVCLPITTGAVTSPMGLGSDSLPVKINLFNIDTYLADSMQFHLEYMLRYIDSGVHYIMPTFRGEEADERHLCQFYHSEAEIIGNLSDVMSLVNEYILFLLENLLNSCENAILNLAGTTEHITDIIKIMKNGIKTITFNEAMELLKDDDKYFIEYKNPNFRTITPLGEQELMKLYNGIVWVTNYDYASIPFYQKKADDGLTGLNADLLFGIGEVVGCGERNETYEQLISSMNEHCTAVEGYEWYLYMKKYFPIKSSGFGMGMERFLLFVIHHKDIRDIQLIPRFNGIEILP